MPEPAPQPSEHSTLRALVLHPVIVSALAIWLLNDHVLKHHCGSWWTGKLSDVVALVAGPVVLAGLWSLATRSSGFAMAGEKAVNPRPRLSATVIDVTSKAEA